MPHLHRAHGSGAARGRPVVLAIACAASLASCSAPGGNDRDRAPLGERASAVRIGSTTAHDLRGTLGEPAPRRVSAGGREVWAYLGRGEARGRSWLGAVPGLGIFTPGREPAERRAEALIVRLRGGVVSGCALLTSPAATIGDAVAARVGPAPELDRGDTVETACGG